jgi:hypothetical protein
MANSPKRAQKRPTKKQQDQYEAFGQLACFTGLAAVIASVVAQSVVPVVLAGIGLLCALFFVNGLGT